MTILSAFLISNILGYIANYVILDKILWPRVMKDGAPTDRWVARTLGIFERLLYSSALLMSYPQWILFWLGLKTGQRWIGWKEDQKRIYNLFLIGNAINVLFGLIGYWLVAKFF